MNTKARVILQSFHFIFRFFSPCVLKLRERKINKFEEILSSGRAKRSLVARVSLEFRDQ